MSPSIALRKIGLVGLGYVGLCTAVCFAAKGLAVVGVDISGERVEALQAGRTTIFEDGLDEHLQKALEAGAISFATSYEGLRGSDYIFLTVGTPGLPGGSIDLSQVRTASRQVAKILAGASGFPVIVVKSTVLPGTAKDVVRPLLEGLSGKKCGRDFGLCSNPEFLREGSAIQDTLHPERVVIGSEDERSRQKVLELYGEFYGLSPPPVVNTNLSTAELIKYSNNAFLAMKVSFINSIARLCERTEGADVRNVAKALGLDSRIGPKFLEAGPGYGGSCFPKDVQALISFAKRVGETHSLFSATQTVNKSQAKHIVKAAVDLLGNLRGKSVSVLGLSFKPGTDDVRESPSTRVIRELLRSRSRIRVYDPKAMENAKRVFGRSLSYANSAEECLKGSDLAIVMTAWKEFARLTPEDFSRSMRKARVLDARLIYDPHEFSKIQFSAVGLGGPAHT